MNRRKEEKKIRLAVELGEQYGEILRALSRMPKETKAHRDARWKWFRTHPEYEQMFGKTMEAYSPSGYRLMVRCKGSGDLSGMSSRENKEIGSEEFLLAVKETVEEYTEEKAEAGKEGSFLWPVWDRNTGRTCREHAGRSAMITGVPCRRSHTTENIRL